MEKIRSDGQIISFDAAWLLTQCHLRKGRETENLRPRLVKMLLKNAAKKAYLILFSNNSQEPWLVRIFASHANGATEFRSTLKKKERQTDFLDGLMKETHLTEEDIWMAIKNLHSRYSNHWSSEECKLKIQWDTTTHLQESLKLKRLTMSNVTEDVEKLEFSLC